MTELVKKNTPTSATFCIADITAAVEYWLSKQIFRENIEVKSIVFKTGSNEFKIEFHRNNP